MTDKRLGTRQPVRGKIMDSPSSESDAQTSELAGALLEFHEITRKYTVLPHERWVGMRIVRNVYSPSPKPSRTTRKDGIIGCIGTGIIYGTGVPFVLLGIVGLGSLFVSGGANWSYSVIGVALVGIFLALLRAIPTIRASQRYLKTGDWRRTQSREQERAAVSGVASPFGTADSSNLAPLAPPPPPSTQQMPPFPEPPNPHGSDDPGGTET